VYSKIKTKYWVSLSISILGTLLCIFLITKTISLHRNNTDLKQTIATHQLKLQQLPAIKKQLQSITTSPKQEHTSLIKTITSYADAKALKLSYSAPVLENENGLKKEQHTFVLEGNYEDLIRLTHSLEYTHTDGEVVHSTFSKYWNREQKKNILSCTIIVEKITADS